MAFAAVLTQEAYAAKKSPDCDKLILELRAMKKAEAILFANMTENNETMASTLDQYAGELKQAATYKRPVTSRDIKSLKSSAQAFRQHKAREKKLVAKFGQASDRVLIKVESCLNR
jgi:hypothetical protein